MKLATLVSYCSLERHFLETIVRNAILYSDVVVVSMGDRRYTGEVEQKDDVNHVEQLCQTYTSEHCTVALVVYPVTQQVHSDPIFFHNQARLSGFNVAKQLLGHAAFWTLFLDGDEIPDGARFKAWLDDGAGHAIETTGPAVMYKFSNYWAFMHPCLVAETTEDSILFAHSDLLNDYSLTHVRERDGIYMWHAESPIGNKMLGVRRSVPDAQGIPMFWHFSWVRSTDGYTSIEGLQQGLKNKVANWGHTGDNDWNKAIDIAFERLKIGLVPEFEFVHGYKLRLVQTPEFITCFNETNHPIEIPKNETKINN